MHATVTLSASSARGAGIKDPHITNLTIPLTTHADLENGLPDFSLTAGPLRQGKYHLGLSAARKKKLSKLKSVTLTLHASYTLGSSGEISLRSKTFTLTHTGASTVGASGSPTIAAKRTSLRPDRGRLPRARTPLRSCPGKTPESTDGGQARTDVADRQPVLALRRDHGRPGSPFLGGDESFTCAEPRPATH
jgi:hypothetical protein